MPKCRKEKDALENTQELLASIAQASADAIYAKDRQSRWLFVNPALEAIAGKPVSELLGKTDAETYSNPEIGKVILDHDRKVMESGKPEIFEEFVDLADGRHFFISVKSPRFNEKGEVIGLIGISHDITARKRREEQLRASEKKYKDLIETTSDFVWEVDTHGRYTYCSPQMEKLWGLKPEKMIGKSPFDKMPPEAKEEVEKFYESIIVSKKPFNGVQVPSVDGQGNLILIEVNGVPFFDDKGELLGFRGISRDITERKKAEKALRESEEQLRKAVEDAPIPTLMQAEDGQVLQISHSWTELTGYTINHVRSFDEWITRAVYGQDANQVRDHLHELFRGDKRSVDVEFTLRTLKGDIRYWSFSASSPGALLDGRRFIVGMAIDITERKQMEQKIEEYAKNLEGLVEERTKELETSALYARGLLEASLDPLVTINAEGKITDVNKATETATGCSREELVGSDFSNYFVKPDEARRGYLQVFHDGSVRDYPLSIRNKSGKIIEVLYNASLFRNEAGDVEGVFAAARDMTEHKRAEEALLNERKRLFDVLETLPAMVCLLTPDQHVDFANRSFRDRFGNSEGRYCYDYCFGNKEPCSFCESYRPLDTGKPHHWEVNAPDGSVIDAYDFPFTDADGSKKILEMDIDITERRRMERQLKDSERLTAIGATAGMVGHDIRNPLQTITGGIYLIRSDLTSLPEGEEKKSIIESLNEMEKSSYYINKIVEDLQDFTRPIRPVLEKTDLQSLIDDLLGKMGIPEQIKVTVKVQKEAASILTDPIIVRRVMTNLINNAIQAMPEGGELNVNVSEEASSTVITVQDSGIGIAEETKPKLFTPLFTTKSKGQGFGLPVVKRMIEAMNGTVTFESQIGKGTKFIVSLPLQR